MELKFRGKTASLRGFKRLAGWASRDFADSTRFWLNLGKRKNLDREFASCRSLENYYHFSKKVIGLMQHQPEILGLLEHVARISPRNVCEIGTFQGGTNFLIAQALPEVELMIGLDLFVQHTAKLRHFCRPNRELHYLNGSSQEAATVARVESVLGGKKLDFLFIDGDHNYDGVKLDFLNYRHLVRDGGMIAFHDIVPDHRTRFGRDTKMWAGDVPVFWKRIKQAYPHAEFIKDPEQDGLGIGVLEYSAATTLPGDL